MRICNGLAIHKLQQIVDLFNYPGNYGRFSGFLCNLYSRLIQWAGAVAPAFLLLAIPGGAALLGLYPSLGLGLMVRGWWWQGVRASSTDGWEGQRKKRGWVKREV